MKLSPKRTTTQTLSVTRGGKLPWTPNEEDRDEEPRKLNLALPRIYFDSDALIKGIVEVLPEVQAHSHFSRQTANAKEEASCADRILKSWNPIHLKASIYTVMETLDCGFRTYGLSYEKLLPIICQSIDTGFTLIFADFELINHESDLVKELETRVPSSTVYAKSQASAIAIDKQGKELGRVTWGGSLTSGAGVSTWHKGLTRIPDKHRSYQDMSSHRVASSKVERELFLRAVDLALEYGISPKDSIHILYALGNAEYIVTTDSHFLSVLNRDTRSFPLGLRPSEILERWGSRIDS